MGKRRVSHVHSTGFDRQPQRKIPLAFIHL
jgi:hypothetical protein